MAQAPLTNDTAQLTPQTTHGGPVLEFDFPAFRVGIAEYVEGPTGCTVFHFPYGAVTAVDVRGGSPKAYGNYDFNHAICLAGGSVYGLEAAAGVTAELFAMHDYSTAPEQIAPIEVHQTASEFWGAATRTRSRRRRMACTPAPKEIIATTGA